MNPRTLFLALLIPAVAVAQVVPSTTPVTISASPTALGAFDPDDNHWSGVALSSTSDWRLVQNNSVSDAAGGACEFVLFPPNGGTAPVQTGSASRNAGSSPATLQSAVAAGNLSDGYEEIAFGAGDVIRLIELTVSPASAGNATLAVYLDGPNTAAWRLYGPSSPTTVVTRSGTTPLLSGTNLSQTAASLAISTAGTYVFAIFRTSSSFTAQTFRFGALLASAPPNVTLSPNVPYQVSGVPFTQFTVQPSAGVWNGVASTDCAGFFLGGAAAWQSPVDIVLADGRNHPLGNTTGVVHAQSCFPVSGIRVLEHRVATPITCMSRVSATLDANRQLDLYEFDVPGAGGGFVNFGTDFLLSASGGLYWAIYDPDAGPESWSTPTPVASGFTSTGQTWPITLAAGWHALAIVRSTPGPAMPAVDYAFGFAGLSGTSSATGSLALTSGAPRSNIGTSSIITIAPGGSHFEVVGVSSLGNCSVAMAGVLSEDVAAAWPEFLIADGSTGSVSPVTGWCAEPCLLGWPGKVEHAGVTTLTVGTPLTVAWGLNRAIRVQEFNVPAAANYSISVTGVSSMLSWHLFGPAPNSGWRGASAALISDRAVTGTQVTGMALQPGWHAIVVTQQEDGGVGTPFGSITSLVSLTPNPVPMITSISPSSQLAGSPTFTLTVTGTGFNTSSRVRWNGAQIGPTTYVDSTTLTISVGSTHVAQAGTASVTVFNPLPAGGTSNSVTFTITNPVPTLVSIAPTSVLAGVGPVTLTVDGTNFVATSVVRRQGVSLSTAFVSDTRLTATITSAMTSTPQTRQITVVNFGPGGGTSSSLPFSVVQPNPSISALSPSSRHICGPLSPLTVTGVDFLPTSTVAIDGVVVPTTAFVSSTELTASGLETMGLTLGSHSVTVVNPPGYGGATAPATFTVHGVELTGLSPGSIPLMTALSPSVNVAVLVSAQSLQGSPNLLGWQVHADGVALNTQLASFPLPHFVATIPSGFLLAQHHGGLAIAIKYCNGNVSNALALRVGLGATANNLGTIGHHPLADPLVPGAPFDIVLEGCAPNQAFTLELDLLNPLEVVPWPSAAYNMVYGLSSPTEVVVFDGLGVHGPAQPFAVFGSGARTAPGGHFEVNGILAPNPAANLMFTMQAYYLDPASPVGFRFTWPRYRTGI